MKKSFYLMIICLFLIIFQSAVIATTYTEHYRIPKPAHGEANWDATLRRGMDIIDTSVYSVNLQMLLRYGDLVARIGNIHDNNGTATYRVWYVSPSDSITDHSNASVEGSLAWVVSQISPYYAYIVLPGNHIYDIDGNITIGESMYVFPQPGAMLTKGSGSGKLEISRLQDVPYRVFDDKGISTWVRLPLTPLVRPEWWGAAADANCSAPIKSAIEVGANNKHPIILSGSLYPIQSDNIKITKPVTIKGSGRALTTITWDESTPAIEFGDMRNRILYDADYTNTPIDTDRINGSSLSGLTVSISATGATGIYHGGCSECTIDDVEVIGTGDNETGFYFDGLGANGLYWGMYSHLTSLMYGTKGCRPFKTGGIYAKLTDTNISKWIGKINSNTFIMLHASGGLVSYDIGPSYANSFYHLDAEDPTGANSIMIRWAQGAQYNKVYGLWGEGAFAEVVNVDNTPPVGMSLPVDSGNRADANWVYDYFQGAQSNAEASLGNMNFLCFATGQCISPQSHLPITKYRGESDTNERLIIRSDEIDIGDGTNEPSPVLFSGGATTSRGYVRGSGVTLDLSKYTNYGVLDPAPDQTWEHISATIDGVTNGIGSQFLIFDVSPQGANLKVYFNKSTFRMSQVGSYETTSSNIKSYNNDYYVWEFRDYGYSNRYTLLFSCSEGLFCTMISSAGGPTKIGGSGASAGGTSSVIVEDQGNLTSTVSTIGGSRITVGIGGNTTIDGNTTILNTTSLLASGSGMIKTGAYKLTIDTPDKLSSFGRTQTIDTSGGGRVVFTNPGIIDSSWFGSGGAAIQKAINSAPSGSVIRTPAGSTYITSPIVNTNNAHLTFRGDSSIGSKLIASGAGMDNATILTQTSISGGQTAYTISYEDIYFDCNQLARTGLRLTNMYVSTINRLNILQCSGPGLFLDNTGSSNVMDVLSINDSRISGNEIGVLIQTNSKSGMIPHIVFNNCNGDGGVIGVRALSVRAPEGWNYGGFITFNGGMWESQGWRSLEFLNGPWYVAANGIYVENGPNVTDYKGNVIRARTTEELLNDGLRITSGGRYYPSNERAVFILQSGALGGIGDNSTEGRDGNSTVICMPGSAGCGGINTSQFTTRILGRDYDARIGCYGSPEFLLVQGYTECNTSGAYFIAGNTWIDSQRQQYKALNSATSGGCRWKCMDNPVRVPIVGASLPTSGAVPMWLMEGNGTISRMELQIDDNFTSNVAVYYGEVLTNSELSPKSAGDPTYHASIVLPGNQVGDDPDNASITDGYYTNWTMTWTDGNNTGDILIVDDYNYTTQLGRRVMWLKSNWTKQPNIGDHYTITPNVGLSIGTGWGVDGTTRQEYFSTAQLPLSKLVQGTILASDNVHASAFLGNGKRGKYIVGKNVYPDPSWTTAKIDLFPTGQFLTGHATLNIWVNYVEP